MPALTTITVDSHIPETLIPLSKWVALTEKVLYLPPTHQNPAIVTDPSFLSTGGKVKPLKQAKKATKELDEDDKAFLEKKRAGTTCSPIYVP